MAKAIETQYAGHRFRSRLEARWAVFFDSLGITWHYEEEGYELPSGRYLPDFRLEGIVLPRADIHAEVKGRFSSLDYLRLLNSAFHLPQLTRHGQPSYQLLILGDIPEPGAGWLHKVYGVNHGELFMQEVFFEASGAIIPFGPMLKHLDQIRRIDEPPEWLSGLAEEQLRPSADARLTLAEEVDRAYQAARSARFEFGESGGR